MALSSKNIYLPMMTDTQGDVTLVLDEGNASVFPSNICDIGGSGHIYSGVLLYPSGIQ